MEFQNNEFESQTFKNINFADKSFKNSSFIDCVFENCNFSNINNPKIYFKKELHTDSFTEYNYRAYVYVISYNILIIKNGNGNLKFVN